jgi:hypothetical protein
MVGSLVHDGLPTDELRLISFFFQPERKTKQRLGCFGYGEESDCSCLGVVFWWLREARVVFYSSRPAHRGHRPHGHGRGCLAAIGQPGRPGRWWCIPAVR